MASSAAASSSAMRRRPPSSEVDKDGSKQGCTYSKLDKGTTNQEAAAEKGINWVVALLVLLFFRHMSATSNIIHDCDEVFNYWEPLHYILYKSGFQTWEYSSEFALRSYLYLLFHGLVAAPAAWLFEDKIRVFYAVRLFLGLISSITETVLVVALSRKYGTRIASYTLAMLCLTSGCFFAGTSLLPSSFSMYTVTLSSAFFLLDRNAMAVSVAAAGVIVGWPFSILAVLPVTLYSLYGNFKRVFVSGFLTTTGIMALSVLMDYYYYGRWTSSVMNLLVYNVFGGGESHLYGTEGPLFYLKNGFNNFNLSLVLALLFLVSMRVARRRYAPELLVVVSPVYIWLAFMSLQAHKEERFLYPIYPLICVSAAAVIDSFPDFVQNKYKPELNTPGVMFAKLLRPLVLGMILCASHGRTFSILHGYSAPLTIYKHLEYHDDAGTDSVLCVGSEWHRFPSSFFVPSHVREVRWIDDGFGGLLPFPFNSSLGCTQAAPQYFNNKNKASEDQYLRDLDLCTFLVELDLKREDPSRGSDLSKWEVVAALPYLDREKSPPLYRAIFIPYLWQEKNTFGMYKLLQRIRP